MCARACICVWMGVSGIVLADYRKHGGFERCSVWAAQNKKYIHLCISSHDFWKHFFTIRVAEAWYKLPAYIVGCRNTASFKASMLPVIRQHYTWYPPPHTYARTRTHTCILLLYAIHVPDTNTLFYVLDMRLWWVVVHLSTVHNKFHYYYIV